MIDKLPLTQNDLDNLAASFITPELAKQAGLFRVDDVEGAEIVGKKRKAGTDYATTSPSFVFNELSPADS